MMLHITGLWQYHHPVPSEPSRSRNAGAILAPPPPEAYSTPINAGNHLAGNRFEAQWFSAHFDMLFPHFHIENLLSGIAVYEKRNFSNQLVAVDHQHFVVWNVIIDTQDCPQDWFQNIFPMEVDATVPINVSFITGIFQGSTNRRLPTSMKQPMNSSTEGLVWISLTFQSALRA